MTKRWSSTRSDLLKTKRQASKLRRRDKEPSEATFESFEEMMEYLDSTVGEEEPK